MIGCFGSGGCGHDCSNELEQQGGLGQAEALEPLVSSVGGRSRIGSVDLAIYVVDDPRPSAAAMRPTDKSTAGVASRRPGTRSPIGVAFEAELTTGVEERRAVPCGVAPAAQQAA
ncbi:unnamed protein product [Urochloa humidicola]